jgi:hypothetical protein
MVLLMVMTTCLLLYAALEYHIRKALKDHQATFPNQKDQPVQNPRSPVGISVLRRHLSAAYPWNCYKTRQPFVFCSSALGRRGTP